MKVKPPNERPVRFLYCPWRVGSTLTVLRHLIVGEGPKRITVQLAPYDGLSEGFRRTKSVVHVDRQELDRLGWFWKWQDAEFRGDYRCPLGRLYASEEAARFALEAWARATLDAREINPASWN